MSKMSYILPIEKLWTRIRILAIEALQYRYMVVCCYSNSCIFSKLVDEHWFVFLYKLNNWVSHCSWVKDAISDFRVF